MTDQRVERAIRAYRQQIAIQSMVAAIILSRYLEALLKP